MNLLNPPLYDPVDQKPNVLVSRSHATMVDAVHTNLSPQNSVPAWGSYLYQNFLLPAFSPSDWLNTPSSTMNQVPPQSMDYFSQGQGWAALASDVKVEPTDFTRPPLKSRPAVTVTSPIVRFQPQPQAQPGPSSFYPQPYYYNPTVPTSLLMSQSSSSNHNISPSIDVIDSEIAKSPSPISSSASPPDHSPRRATKRRASSMDSDLDDHYDHDHDEHDHDVPEGVEKDGMIWGMKVEDYRALCARERKRVRNRISARTFRAKRKGEQSYHSLRPILTCI